jgi:hypothetical protein
MGYEEIGDNYHRTHDICLAIQRQSTGYRDEGYSAKHGEMHLNPTQYSDVAGTTGSRASGHKNARFTFTVLGLRPPFSGRQQIEVKLNSVLQRYGSTYDYTAVFDKGKSASTPDTDEPTPGSSYIQFNQDIGAEDWVHVRVFA